MFSDIEHRVQNYAVEREPAAVDGGRGTSTARAFSPETSDSVLVHDECILKKNLTRLLRQHEWTADVCFSQESSLENRPPPRTVSDNNSPRLGRVTDGPDTFFSRRVRRCDARESERRLPTISTDFNKELTRLGHRKIRVYRERNTWKRTVLSDQILNVS